MASQKAVNKDLEEVKAEIEAFAQSEDWHKLLNVHLISKITGIHHFKLRNNLSEKYASLTIEDKQKVIEVVKPIVKRFFLFFGNDMFLLDDFAKEIKRREDIVKSQIVEVLKLGESEEKILSKLSTVKSLEFSLEDIAELYKIADKR